MDTRTNSLEHGLGDWELSTTTGSCEGTLLVTLLCSGCSWFAHGMLHGGLTRFGDWKVHKGNCTSEGTDSTFASESTKAHSQR